MKLTGKGFNHTSEKGEIVFLAQDATFCIAAGEAFSEGLSADEALDFAPALFVEAVNALIGGTFARPGATDLTDGTDGRFIVEDERMAVEGWWAIPVTGYARWYANLEALVKGEWERAVEARMPHLVY
ncbi:MAG: hypothetical protein N2318_10860 [Meiothermus sp.]|nr:hypothetical protein [Meiothermus sp.]